MFTLKKDIQPMVFRSFSTNRNYRFLRRISPLVVSGLILVAVLFCGKTNAASASDHEKTFPVEMEGLMGALTNASTPSGREGDFPRVVEYEFTEWNMREDTLETTLREFRIPQRPIRIIPHSVGLTEILWAIAPREHIAAVHRNCLRPDYSFIADAIPENMEVYESEDAELVIGLRPDLILTTYYSSETFKNRLRLSSIPFVECGFFGNIPSIQKQIKILGKIIGEERNARHLIETMESNIAAIQKFVRARRAGEKLRVIYYGHQGIVAGAGSTFDSMCDFLEVENVAAAEGIHFFKQIDYETLLKWDPDMIIVPEESSLEDELTSQEILKAAKAVLTGNIQEIPNVYLMASSQFAVASLNYMGGLFYGD